MGRQVQIKGLKKPVVIFLPIILLIGTIMLFQMVPIGKILNASTQPSLFKVAVDGKNVTDEEYITEKENVKVKLTAKETGVYKLPYDEDHYLVELEEDKLEIPYIETTEESFDLDDQTISHLTVNEGSLSDEEKSKSETGESVEEKEIAFEEPINSEVQTPTIESTPDSAILKVRKDKEDSKGYFCLKLKEKESVTFSIRWKDSETQSIAVTDTTDSKKEQTLITFDKKEAVKEPTITKDTTEKQKDTKDSKDKKESKTSDKKLKGMNVDIAPLELRGGSDVVRLKDPKLVVQTGEKNFDPDDDPGHDSSPSNDIVRTWDKVTYAYSFSIESTNSSKSYKNIRYRVDAHFKDARKKVNGQLRDYAYFPEGTLTGNQSAETRDANYTTSGVISGSAGIVDSVINLQVLAATHDYELLPTITITILDAVDNETGETIKINSTSENMVSKSVKVSAKPNINATIGRSETIVALMTNISPGSSLNSYAQGMGMELALVPLNDSGISRTGSLFEMLYGATFPVGEVKVTVKTKAYSILDSNGSRHDILFGIDQDAPQVISEGILDGKNRTSSSLNKTPEFNHLNLLDIDMANGIWNIAYSKIAGSGLLEEQAVYDTNVAKIKNTPTKDTLSYSFNNSAAVYKERVNNVTSTLNDNVEKLKYASVFSLMNIPYDYILDKNASLYTQFETTNLSYEGKEYSNKSTYTNNSSNILKGTTTCYTPVIDNSSQYIGSGKAKPWAPSGDGSVYTGQKIYANPVYNITSFEAIGLDGITAWNAEVYQYDQTRSLVFSDSKKIDSYYFGVLKNGKKVPSLDAKHSVKNTEYDWYSTYEEAKSKGTISAIKSIFKKNTIEKRMEVRTRIPLIVIGDKLNDFQSVKGDGNFLLSSINAINESGEIKHTFPTSGSIFQPSVLDSSEISGIKFQIPGRTYGETLMIVPFTARVTKTPIRTSYNSDEIVQWKLTPVITADDDESVTFTLKDTIPKEIQYISGSSKYGTQEIEPIEEDQPDGSTLLTWTIPYHKKDAPIRTLVFDSMVNGKNIKYDSTNIKNVTNQVIISAKTKDGLVDESIEDLRKAEASTTITKVSTTVIEKSTSTSKIEIGTNNPAMTDGEKDTTVRYSLYNKNESKTESKNTKILDIFPYASDGRGTTFEGYFDLLSLKVMSVNKPKIYYCKQEITSTTNPNDIDTSAGWSVYNGGRVADVKAIYLEYDKLDVGEENTIDISLVAKNQKVKDVLVNSAKLDNNNNNPVQSIFVKSTVIGRSIKGIAWYDDNLDGKKNVSEAVAPNIPVKLYRTSHENGSYKNELVEENLLGLKFIDPSGNSSIKTNSSGEYVFTNLPEGEYVAYFDIGKDVTAQKFKVTKKDGVTSSQAVDTSKADQTSYKTDVYDTPTLNGGNFPNNEWKVENINIGLVRPSRIRLFKFITGTATDANGDGELSDAEKATGTPLKGAEFDIYKGDLEEKIGSAITDGTGNLEFYPLFEGNYTLVETKAPEGYELIKNPIKVTITGGNQTIQVFQEDDKKTELPFTGGNGPLLAILLAASGAMVLGFGYMLWYYRMPKKKGGR